MGVFLALLFDSVLFVCLGEPSRRNKHITYYNITHDKIDIIISRK